MEALFNGAIDHFPEIELPQINPKAPMTDQDADKVVSALPTLGLDMPSLLSFVPSPSSLMPLYSIVNNELKVSVGFKRLILDFYGRLQPQMAAQGFYIVPHFIATAVHHFYERTQATCLSGQGL